MSVPSNLRTAPAAGTARSCRWNGCALRNIVVGLGTRTDGVPRQTGFDITAASDDAVACALKAHYGKHRIVAGRPLPDGLLAENPVAVNAFPTRQLDMHIDIDERGETVGLF